MTLNHLDTKQITAAIGFPFSNTDVTVKICWFTIVLLYTIFNIIMYISNNIKKLSSDAKWN